MQQCCSYPVVVALTAHFAAVMVMPSWTILFYLKTQ
jgi:hypothetical protein